MLRELYRGDIQAEEKCAVDVKPLKVARVKRPDGIYAVVAYDSDQALKEYQKSGVVPEEKR